MKLKINEISYNSKMNLFELDIEEEEILVTYEELEKYKLSSGDIIDSDLYLRLKTHSLKNKGMSLALKYISSRLISSYKLRTYLDRKGIDKSAIDLIIEELEKNKILDDELYLEYYIKDKKDINLRSKNHIYLDLISMGFDSSLVNIFLEDYENKEEAHIAKQLVIRKNYHKKKTPNQIYAYLARKGFRSDAIKASLDNIGDD